MLTRRSWATGMTWWQIPKIAKVTFTGVLPVGVTGKDVVVALAGLFNNDEVLNHAIEFHGSEQTLRSLSIDNRMTIANYTTEWGGLSGLWPIDSVLEAWLRYKATTAAMFPPSNGQETPFTHARIDDLIQNQLVADKGATYAKTLYLSKCITCNLTALRHTDISQTFRPFPHMSQVQTASRLQHLFVISNPRR